MKKFVSIERDSEDELFVDGVQVVIKDLVGTNGVLHVIDGVIVPPSARYIKGAVLGARPFRGQNSLKVTLLANACKIRPDGFGLQGHKEADETSKTGITLIE